MSVNATGLGELLGMPELSVQTAIRPGIPASAPDFLSIMALKAAAPAKAAAVGVPSAGDGNPTTEETMEDAQAVPVPGAAQDQTDESADMAFDLQLPATPAPQSPAPEPKTAGTRFAEIASRHLLPAAKAQNETPVEAEAETDTAVSDPGTGAESDAPETSSISPEASAVPPPAPLAVPPAVPVIAAAADQADAEPLAVAGQVRAAPNGNTVDRVLPDVKSEALAPAEAEAEAATPLPATSTNPSAVPAAPAMQRPAMPQRAVRGERGAVVEAAGKADPGLGAVVEGADSRTASTSAPLREALPASQTAEAVLAAIHDPLSARPQAASAAQGQTAGQIVSNEAVLDDLLIGNAVEDQWVDQLAADIETLVKGDHREARLHLKPRELGDLFIRLETNGNQAKVHFTVETAAAQGFIADAAPRLQSMMENRGVRLEEASVDVGGGRQDRGEQPRETAFESSFGTRPRGAAPQAETLRAIVRQTAIERFA